MVSAAVPKVLLLISLFGILISSPVLAAVTQDKMAQQLQRIEDHLKEIDKQQAAILQQQQDILKKLDVVKIWARRS